MPTFCRSVTKLGIDRGLAIRYTKLVNFALGVPRYYAAICISPSLMHLLVFYFRTFNNLLGSSHEVKSLDLIPSVIVCQNFNSECRI